VGQSKIGLDLRLGLARTLGVTPENWRLAGIRSHLLVRTLCVVDP